MIETTAYYVGVGLANLINIFNPEIVLLGGGVTKIGPPLLEPAGRIARERAYVTWACDVEIRTALLGDDSPTATQLLHRCLNSRKNWEITRGLEQLTRLKGTEAINPFLPRLRELAKENGTLPLDHYTRQRAARLLD